MRKEVKREKKLWLIGRINKVTTVCVRYQLIAHAFISFKINRGDDFLIVTTMFVSTWQHLDFLNTDQPHSHGIKVSQSTPSWLLTFLL